MSSYISQLCISFWWLRYVLFQGDANEHFLLLLNQGTTMQYFKPIVHAMKKNLQSHPNMTTNYTESNVQHMP